MHWILIVVCVIASMNFLLLIGMVFLEKRKPQTIISWLTVLTFLPVFGFLLYVIFGSGLSVRTRRMIKKKAISERDIIKNIDGIQNLNNAKLDGLTEKDRQIITYCYNYGAYPCPGSDVEILNNGIQKISSLKKDLLNAKKSINIEYYIFAKDETGRQIMDILCQKAREGVDVRLIYDSIGSRKAPRRFFKKLTKAGGQVAEFFPPFMHMRLINLKLNYRNHRKIVVIDGKIGYTGGINIRDDHMGLDKKLTPWRDTHIRIEGAGVYGLQNIFIDDWRYCKKDNTPPKVYLEKGYFPTPELKGDITVQILSSGPDSQVQKIKEAFIKLIATAEKRIWIQTPYFIPDDSFLSALRIAIKSGVDVRVMVPYTPDKKSVYYVTISYLKELVEMGGRVYLYQGFLHSKTMLIDDNKLSIGTCNTDNRSFGLNFEDTAIMYSSKLNTAYQKTYQEDINNSFEVNLVYFKRKRWLTKFLQAIFRLLAPLF